MSLARARLEGNASSRAACAIDRHLVPHPTVPSAFRLIGSAPLTQVLSRPPT